MAKETEVLDIQCMICGKQLEIEVPKEVSEALGKSILNVCIPCSQKTPEELKQEDFAWQWVKTKP